MTALLDRAVEAARNSSPDVQDAIARLVLDMVDRGVPEPLSPAELVAVLEGEAEADRGDFAHATEVAEALRRFRS